MTERDTRIDRWLTPTSAAIIPPRLAHWLESEAGLTADFRIKLMRTDPVAYEVLKALHVAALHWGGSADGTNEALDHGRPPQSDEWLTTSQAGDRLGMTDRGIRKKIAQEQIPAEFRGRQWFIHRNTIDAIRAAA